MSQNSLKPCAPYPVRFKHNHKVTDRVIAENTKRCRLIASGGERITTPSRLHRQPTATR